METYDVRSHKVYLTIYDGRICQRTSAEDPQAVKRTNKNDKIVFERYYEAVAGKIQDITFKPDADYGDKWEIHLNSAGEEVVLQVSHDSRFGLDLLTKIPNIDWTRKVIFKPYSWTPAGDDKKTSGLIIYHDSTDDVNKVSNYYVKREGDKVTYINGLPTFSGDYEKDKDDFKIYKLLRSKFLKDEALNKFIPGNRNFIQTIPTTQPEQDVYGHAKPAKQTDDDLPF